MTVRTQEEGGTGLAGRIALVLAYLAPALGTPGIEVRLHDRTLYATTFRFDDDLLVNTHVWGSPAGANPLLHLKDGPEALDGTGLPGGVRASVERRGAVGGMAPDGGLGRVA